MPRDAHAHAEWRERLLREVPHGERAAFLIDVQALVADLREHGRPVVSPLLRRHARLAIDYLDDGDKKERARRLLGVTRDALDSGRTGRNGATRR